VREKERENERERKYIGNGNRESLTRTDLKETRCFATYNN